LRGPGIPNKASGAIKELARSYGADAIRRLGDLAGLGAPGAAAESQATQVLAIRELLDRGYGKATQVLASDPDNPLTYVIRGPSPVESTAEWLRLHAPKIIDADANEG
jgi:hypothetical protein